MHMCTFNTYTLSQKLSHLGKWLPIIVQVSLTNVALEFSAISVYSLLWQSPYCLWNVRIAKLIRGIWNHYRYPRPCPVFHCLHYVLPATESWVGPGSKTTHSVFNVNPSCLWLQLISDLQANLYAAGTCLPYVATTCNLQSLPHCEYVQQLLKF